MTEQFKEGFRLGQKEFNKKVTELVKAQTLATLEAIEKKKEQKAKVEEELRILKLDLDDLKAGRIEKIKERINKSRVAKDCTRIDPWQLLRPFAGDTWSISPNFWNFTTSGTYQTSSGRHYYISF